MVFAMAMAIMNSVDESAKSCSQTDWVGTYLGTRDCDGIVEKVTVIITASGSNSIIIKVESPGLESEYDPLTPDGCKVNNINSKDGLTATVDASLNSDKLTLKWILSDSDNSATCITTAIRS